MDLQESQAEPQDTKELQDSSAQLQDSSTEPEESRTEPQEYRQPSKCSFKIEKGACLVTAPEDHDILPGRMIRQMVANLEKHFQLYEYSMVEGDKTVDEMEDVVGVVELSSGTFAKLFGKRKYCVFQKLHPSLYDENFIELSGEEEESFSQNLPAGEEFVKADFTVSMPPYYYIVATRDESRKLMDVLNHLKLRDFNETRDAVARLCEASVTVFDEVELLAEYEDRDFPGALAAGLEEFLEAPRMVEHLDL